MFAGIVIAFWVDGNPSGIIIPFVFLTASAEKSEVEAGLGMGADGYIRKPFEPHELFDTITDCLNEK